MEIDVKMNTQAPPRGPLTVDQTCTSSSDGIAVPYTIETITADITPGKDKPLWPLSSYGPAKHQPVLICGLDESPEELRLKAVIAHGARMIHEYVKYEGEKAAAADHMYANARDNIRQLYADALTVSARVVGPVSALGGSAASTFSKSIFGAAAVSKISGVQNNPSPGSPLDAVANVIPGDGGITARSPTTTETEPEDPTDAVPSPTTPTGGFAHEDVQMVDTHYLDEIRSKFPRDSLCTSPEMENSRSPPAGGCADICKGTLHVPRTAIKVAIKAIKVYSVEDNSPKRTKRLRREIKVWMRLNHTNVLSLFGTTSGFGPLPAMVCPWLDNGTLTSYLERHHGDLETLKILVLIHGVASGLQYLHSQSIVHGDLSGSNVLIGTNGRACITDFGLSAVLDEIGSTFATSSTREPRWTLRWAAPELLGLLDHDDVTTFHTGPTTQSDIYSFGSIVLQILSGKIPYHYYTRDVQIVAAIFRGETPTRPNDLSVTDHRWRFIQRCWSPFRDVIRRPSSDEIVTFSMLGFHRGEQHKTA